MIRRAILLGLLLAAPAMAQGDQARPGQIGDTPYSVQGVSILFGLLVSALTIIGFIRSWMNKNLDAAQEREDRAQEREDRLRAAIEKHNDSVESRLTKLEVRSADFMPRAEIEGKIEHEKGNRVQAVNGLKSTLDKHDDAIVGIKVEVGKIAQQSVGIVTEMGEIKLLVKEMARDTASKLEKMTDAISHGGGR